ncbi:hypothetical protein [Xenorhabdus bovienii]|uniref:hypothetical protein n=1 Tax=Xenorhabdus bovienii TaxID=40576 RepID=UPI003DA436A9
MRTYLFFDSIPHSRGIQYASRERDSACRFIPVLTYLVVLPVPDALYPLYLVVNPVDLEHVFCQIDANRYNSHIAPPLVVLSTTSYRWFREGATIPL